MVTQAEFDRVQVLLGKRGNPRPQSPLEFAFTGLIRCGECQRMVTAEEKHQVRCGHCGFKFAYRRRDSCPRCATPIAKMANPRFLHFSYYHCTNANRRSCSQKAINSRELERQIDAFLTRIQISTKFKQWALQFLHELHAQESAARNDILQAQQKCYRDCLQRIDALVRLKTSAGNANGSLLSDEEYRQQRTELLGEKASLEELLRDSGQRVNEWLKLAEQTFEFACTVRERFAKGDTKTRKAILATLGSNLTLKDKILNIRAKEPFLILGESLSDANAQTGSIEPENSGLPPTQNQTCRVPRPNGLSALDQVRTIVMGGKSLFMYKSAVLSL